MDITSGFVITSSPVRATATWGQNDAQTIPAELDGGAGGRCPPSARVRRGTWRRFASASVQSPIRRCSRRSTRSRPASIRRYGLDVEFVRLNDDPTAIQGLIAGEYELVYVGVAPGVVAISKGADIKSIDSFNPLSDARVIAQPDIHTLKDLEGKTIAVSKVGSLSYLLAMAALHKEGVDVSKVRIVAAGNDTLKAQMFMAGRVDATSLATIIANPLLGPDSKVHVVYDIGASLHNEVINTATFARGDFIRNHSGVAQGIVTALIQASRALQSDKALAIKQAVSTGLSQETTQVTYDHLLSMPTPYYGVDGGVNQAVLSAMLKMLHENGDIDRVPSVDDVLDMQFIDTAMKTLGPYKGS